MTYVTDEDPGTLYYALDIETTGLYWPTATVTTFAVYGDGVATVYESPYEGLVLDQLERTLASLPPGVVVTWTGSTFDGPFLAKRSDELLGRERSFHLKPNHLITPKYAPQPGFAPIGHDPVFKAAHGTHEHLDIAYGYWQQWAKDNDVHWSLKDVANAMGIEAIRVNRAQMDSLSVPERMRYCLSDVVATYKLTQIAIEGTTDKEPSDA